MYMILFVLHDPGLLRDVLEAWDQVGVSGITIFPSTGLNRLQITDMLRDDLPIILCFEELSKQEEVLNRTLFTVVKDEGMVDKIVEVTQEIIGDFDEPNTGILTVLPVTRVYGLDRKIPGNQ